MATVVNLSSYRRNPRQSDAPPTTGATIHLFLGVRYERHEDSGNRPETPISKSRGGRRPRKRA
jgi:hypothetical protein